MEEHDAQFRAVHTKYIGAKLEISYVCLYPITHNLLNLHLSFEYYTKSSRVNFLIYQILISFYDPVIYKIPPPPTPATHTPICHP